MKRTYSNWVDLLNQELLKYGQMTRVVEFGKQYLKLADGRVLLDSDFDKFKKRVMHPTVKYWVKNVDALLHGEISEDNIKSMIYSDAGKLCQKIHGENIRKNLNVGVPWNKGVTGIAGHPQTIESRNKISLNNSGENNGMFGRKLTDDEKLHKSQVMKRLILEGKFTPNSNNRNTHWESYFNGKYYRSSWEALYQYFDPEAMYEKFRIAYDFNGEQKIYIVDFINYKTKILVEVKPRELCSDKKFEAKMESLKKWAGINGYSVIIADQAWFENNIEIVDYTQFDEKTAMKIKKFYEANQKNRNRKTK